MKRSKKDRIISLQVQAIEAYKEKHKLSEEDLYKIITEYKLSKFVQDNYELLHLTGTAGIVEEIEAYIQECKGGK